MEPTAPLACSDDACCSCAAALHPGVGLDSFIRRLHHSQRLQQRLFVIKVVGNSVAHWNRYLAARTFLLHAQRAWPAVNFTLPQFNPERRRADYHKVGNTEDDPLAAGAHGAEHMLYCAAEELRGADVVLILYSGGVSSGRFLST